MPGMRQIDPMAAGWLQERMVRCGRPKCRCARGHLHGPYVYLTYRVWDEQADRWRIKQRYVRAEDVLEVRRLLAANKAIRRAVKGMLRNQPRVLESLHLLEEVFPEIVPMLRTLRDHCIRQLDIQPGPETLILDQALAAYAYTVLLGRQAARAMRRCGQEAEDHGPSTVSADSPDDRPCEGGGERQAERYLRQMARLSQVFLRNLDVLKRWKAVGGMTNDETRMTNSQSDAKGARIRHSSFGPSVRPIRAVQAAAVCGILGAAG